MFDTIQTGTSGLTAHAQGLKVVSNNLANVNTPGFKSSQLQFAALFEQGGGQLGREGDTGGGGVEATVTKLSFRSGVDQATGNPLDMAINGNGLFIVRRADGGLLYTRAGDFRFDADNVLTNGAGDRVQGLGAGGQLVDITLDALDFSAPRATSTVTVKGNLTSTVADPAVDATLNAVTIYDKAGLSHTLNLTIKNNGNGDYSVAIVDGASTDAGTKEGTGRGVLKYVGGAPQAGGDAVTFTYQAAGGEPFDVKLDFSGTAALQTATTLQAPSQDGHAAGVRADQGIDSEGNVTVRYSNNETAKGARLALAEFRTEDDLREIAGGMFEAGPGAQVRYGYAGSESFGALALGHREGSNVDLAEEFGNLILMQRGYQASSHVISTANDMIQQLFDMKGR